ncbi:MAG: hypothetical protein WCQ26_00275 [Pseudanabaena sp. ELA748]
MNSSGNSITACRLCQHYNPEGRRGGLCGKLDVPVHSSWDACSLATHPFDRSWQPTNTFSSLSYDSLTESLYETIALVHTEIAETQEISRRSLSFAEC